MSDTANPPAVVPPVVERGNFIETFTLKADGKKYLVPANSIAARAQAQMNLAKVQAVFERALEFYDKHPQMPVDPKSLKILVDAADTINDMTARAYSDTKGTKGGGLANALERMVYAAARGGSAGAADAKPLSDRESRMAKLAAIGRAKPVTPLPAPEQPAIDLDE